jgi:hypothetical protein
VGTTLGLIYLFYLLIIEGAIRDDCALSFLTNNFNQQPIRPMYAPRPLPAAGAGVESGRMTGKPAAASPSAVPASGRIRGRASVECPEQRSFAI